jgi:hypothetical protein
MYLEQNELGDADVRAFLSHARWTNGKTYVAAFLEESVSHRLQVGGARAFGGGGWADPILAVVAGCLAAARPRTKELHVA